LFLVFNQETIQLKCMTRLSVSAGKPLALPSVILRLDPFLHVYDKVFLPSQKFH
jgi:hypothetical protein